MLGNIVVAGAFPMPPSTNMLYATRYKRDGTAIRVLTEEGRQYKEELIDLLSKESNHIYVDKVAVSAIKQNYQKRRSKKVTPIKFHFTIMCVFSDERRDLTNTFKLAEDTIINDFLECNDNRVVSMFPRRLVDPTVEPHIEIELRECTIDWRSGDVIAAAWQELRQQEMYQGTFYSDPTERVAIHHEVTHPALQKWNYPAM